MQVRHGNRGFTLVELMISVALIGILSATAIGLFKDQQLRTIHQRECNGETALEAAGQLGDRNLRMRPEAEKVQQLLRPGVDRGLVEQVVAPKDA